MDSLSLADRMKQYEQATRHTLPARTYTILRVDGRAFHSFLRHADRPFDGAVMAAMDATAAALCADISGAVFAYTQSDEISVLITDFGSAGTQQWFGGVVQKIASVSASVATMAFNAEYGHHYDGATATFDARVFTLPTPTEVANYFVWRQRDAIRNAISMAARAEFSHRELHQVSTATARALLLERGIHFDTYPAGARHGRLCTRTTREEDVTYTDRRTGTERTIRAARSRWETGPAPLFTADPDGPLIESIPAPGPRAA
ncbi:tRNA(His) guanylyltransferase Thg1 family protein [Nocardiopsis sp. CT-R113]|uniref:tRNA(His) guanylyltransferase Thg1 family protein n=1 Tax=Nocardiopsis codii TaxID=3065942 RepID=A0ABU7KD00_9ACTN|nr:tRNA(His) guanylyltransferase Thg1 family protein [Nocardiopsis sp. CT-R113]MEE2040115.1 tRNA(His) guanylyltransferase Thg1 family protein [Nocardiopsis sp. CT-R113]